jgi:DNA-binding NarL/FixJ family response regulator
MVKNKKIRIIVADDHDVFLDGLTLLFSTSSEIELVSTAKDGKQLMELNRQLMPDVILTDLSMPVLDGISAIRLIASTPNPPPMIAISTFDHETLIADAFDAGAMGYIVKNAEKAEIIDAIKKVHAGFTYYCKSTAGQMMKAFANSKFDPYTIAANYLFDAQEKEIIRMVCMEKSSSDIAEAMCLAVRTIEGTRTRIMAKMKVHTLAGFTIYAIKNRLFNIQNMR